MTAPFTPRAAQISIITVENDIIRLGGQKATLAWFRQVIEEPLIA